ncbi:pinin [Cocos nucifera]|uniref:Pinin n=1 Tax=Cocos nucifera TaxID=13894 RepID=A0A8K0MWR2_COCNU|nr:pinin [Cocos nucifera]
MASGAVEKTADELRKEIQELQRQQREITDRLRDPRGLRRTGLAPGGPRPIGGPRQCGAVRPTVESEDQPAPKRRLLSAVVKVHGGETKEDESDMNDAKEKDPAGDVGAASSVENSNQRAVNSPSNGGFRRDGNARSRRMDFDIPTEPVPRNLPKDEDPGLVKRNKRMLGQLLGTLEAEQRALEESERLRQQEREQIAEKRRRDLTLRARVAAKAEEKKLELLFLLWAEHHKKLSNFVRTKAEPPIYYMPAKPLVDDPTIVEQHKEQVFLEWKSARRAELSEFQKQIEQQHISNVQKELERWQNARNARRANNLVTLQETMDQELETHKLEHGPKTRRIPGGNDDGEDVEDIAAEDELMDEVLEVHERIDGDTAKRSETAFEFKILSASSFTLRLSDP